MDNVVPKTYSFFYRAHEEKSLFWQQQIVSYLGEHYPYVRLTEDHPDVLLVLGGDGTILEVARTHVHRGDALIFGLNLGHVGFLASVRDPKDFMVSLDQLFTGNYIVTHRMLLSGSLMRGGEAIHTVLAFNELSIQSLLGVVSLEVAVEQFIFQRIRGTGVLVATASGSTAYNLSAHGPIVTPDLHCMILTELLDHNIPTPSVVLNPHVRITIRVVDFRSHGVLRIAATNELVDVTFAADGAVVSPLLVGDELVITRSLKTVRFAEIEPQYFLQSLQDKFAFR